MVKILKHWDVHGEKVALPDPHQYAIEGTKLAEVRDRLAQRGLKSPWLRNAAWRYHHEWHHQHIWGSFFKLLFKGAPYALGILGIQIVATTLYDKVKKTEEHHFHGFTRYVPSEPPKSSE